MRADDLDHHEFLQLNPEEGIIRFGGERALLVDAVAMGLLRKNLVDSFGATAARTVLTQFGFANGWRMSEAIESQFESPAEWANAGISRARARWPVPVRGEHHRPALEGRRGHGGFLRS